MSGKFHPHNFLNWEIGHQTVFAVRARPSMHDSALMSLMSEEREVREWVELKDGPQLVARAKDGKWQLALQFIRQSHLRQVREWLKVARQPFLVRLALSADGNDWLNGELTLIRCALPDSLAVAPEILLEDDLLKTMGLPRQDLVERFLRFGGIQRGEEYILIADTPIRLEPMRATLRDTVDLYLHSGDILHCWLEGGVEKQFLRAVGYSKESPRTRKLTGIRFIATPGQPRFVASADKIEGANLLCLAPKTGAHLRAWVGYELAEQAREKEDLERRKSADLEYSEVVAVNGAQHTVEVRLVNSVGDLGNWCDSAQFQDDKPVKLDASVELHALTSSGAAEPVRATLSALKRTREHQYVATLTWSSHVVPPARGKICAVENVGATYQSNRREDALGRLLSGESANPDLLSYLLYPRTIPKIESRDRQYHHRAQMEHPLHEAQRAAVVRAAAEPQMLLIQGPPGTGKTTVIAEIIHQLRHRRRNQQDEEERGPLRVLVSSIQNDAVANAAQKLSDQHVFVSVNVRKDEGDDDERFNIPQARQIATKLWQQHQDSRGFRTYQRLSMLRGRLQSLAECISIPDERTAERLHALRQSEEFHEFTSLLREDLAGLQRALQMLLAAIQEDARASEAPEPGVAAGEDRGAGRMADVKAVVAAIADCDGPLDPHNLQARYERVSQLDALLDGDVAVREQFGALDLAMQGSARRLRRASERGEVDERSARAWQEVYEAAREVVQPAAPPAVSSARAPHPAEQWTQQMRDWLQRAQQALDAYFEDFGASESAVIYEWITALNEYPKTTAEIVQDYAPVNAATCQGSLSKMFAPWLYDVVIVDEAGRGGLDVLIPMTLGRTIILIGDQKQLPPHIEQELERRLEEDVRRQVNLAETSLFSYLWDALGGELSPNCIALTRQFRMHRAIGQVVSRAFYEPEVVLEHDCEGGKGARRAPAFGLLENEPLVWVDTADALKNQWPTREGYQESNPYEVDLLMELLRQLDDDAIAELRRRTAGRPIGIIPFYNKQRVLIEQALAADFRHLRDLVELGTVDSFQGKEFPLVFLSTVRSNPRGNVGFLKLPNRLNVGLSRAQSQLILLGDSNTLTHPDAGSEPFKKVWAAMREDGAGKVIAARDVLVYRR